MRVDGLALKEIFFITAGDFITAGEASGKIKKILKQIEIEGNLVRKVCVATYEAELNLVIHSLGGTLQVEISPLDMRVIAQDIGPGIENIDLAMQEGFSTAPESVRQLGFGAGMGLPNMKRCADDFFITSKRIKRSLHSSSY